MITEIEKYKSGIKNFFDLKPFDETEDDNFLMSCTEYDEDLDVILNVFIRRLENGIKKIKWSLLRCYYIWQENMINSNNSDYFIS